MGNRTVIPTPQSYAVVAAIGLAVGLVLWALVGWPWWPMPIVFVVGSWAMSAATAFRGGRHHETVSQLRDVQDPAGAVNRHRARTREAVDTAPFSLFGLASRDREPWLAGSGRSNQVLTSITVAYGDPGAEDERIDVTASVRDEPVEFVLEMQGQELRGRAMTRGGPPIDPLAMTNPAEWSPLDWSPAELLVDGAPTSAHVAAHGGRMTIVAEVGDTGVVIVRSGQEIAVDALALRRIDPSEIAEPPPL